MASSLKTKFGRSFLQLIVVGLLLYPTMITQAADGKIIPLRRGGVAQAPTEAYSVTSVARPFISRPSPRNLLGLPRENSFALPKAVLQSQTIKLLALRVEFAPEEPDDPTTTGDGSFDLRDSTSFKDQHDHLFDASPHDSAYFGKHIEALHQYWSTVSNGKISIAGTVYPPTPRGAYRLPFSMAHYGEKPPSIGLTEFYFDAFRAADTTNPALNFADYDAFCVFHAGSDRQNDWMGNSSNDLFTGFIVLGEPIPVDGGTYFITEGMIMPESASQDGKITVLNGVMAHEFGHQLGLVDLYHTQFFATRVGNFSLMDNGNNVTGEFDLAVEDGFKHFFVSGILPTFPDAWSRAYLGLVNVDTVSADSEAVINAAELDDADGGWAPQVVLVPITADEYFLLEYRRIDLDGTLIPHMLQDEKTNVVLGPADASRQFTREYDYLMVADSVGGNGVLIWHVDETVAAADEIPDDEIPDNFAANTLQWDFDRPFVGLVEADMHRTLGVLINDYGSHTDMFVPSTGRRNFTPETYLSTDANSGARSGISIKLNFVPGSVLSVTNLLFSVTNDQTLPGFPAWCGQDAPQYSPAIVDIDDDGIPEIFIGSGNRILGWRWDGQPILKTNVTDTVISFNGDTVLHHDLAVLATLPAPLAAPPVIGPFLDGDFPMVLIVVDETDSLRIFNLRDEDDDDLIDHVREIKAIDLETSAAGSVILWEYEAGVTLSSGEIFTIHRNQVDTTRIPVGLNPSGIAGTLFENSMALIENGPGSWLLSSLRNSNDIAMMTAAVVYGPVMGDLNHDGTYEAVCAGSDGTIWAFDTALVLLPGFPTMVGGEIYAVPVLGDLDGDGYLEIITVGDNWVYAVNYNGTRSEDYPVEVNRHQPTGPLTFPPMIIDPTGERPAEILLTTTDGDLRLVHPDAFGQLAPVAWPLGKPGIGSPAFGYHPASATAAVWARGGDGYLYGFAWPNGVGDSTRGLFSQAGYDAGRRNVYVAGLPASPAQQFLDESTVYAWPNPVSGEVANFHLRANPQGTTTDVLAVDVAIYDLAGNLIEKWQTELTGVEDNIAWECGDVASGVYFCRLQVQAGDGESQVVFCPVAIVR